MIDGIRLSSAKCIRYRHNDLSQLQRLISENHNAYEQIIIVTESIFSMDGDEADLHALVQLKKSYSNILLYVDEAHAFGVRGDNGLGCAEEQNCINDIDIRESNSLSRSLHCLPTSYPGISNQQDAHVYIHNSPSTHKYSMDLVDTRTTTLSPREKDTFVTDQQQTKDCTCRQRI